MHLMVTNKEKEIQVRLGAALLLVDIQEYHEKILNVLRIGFPVFIDLSNMNEIDIAGIQLLLSLRIEAQQNGIALSIHSPSPSAKRIFDFLNISQQLLQEATNGSGNVAQ